jgi:hypothetical protein
MPIGSVLTHRVQVVSRVSVLDDDGVPVLNEEGHPQVAEQVRTIRADIQPKSAREVASLHEAGAAISTHTIYTTDLAVHTSDAIEHDPELCGRARDLPFGHYEIDGTPDAAGRGSHLEISASLTAPSIRTDPVGSGSTPGSGS